MILRSLLPLLVLAPLAFAQPTTQPSDFTGEWQGNIELPGAQLGVIVKLKHDAATGWGGTIDIPMQAARDLPLESVSVDGTRVVFAIKGIPGKPTFQGDLKDQTIEGTFRQGVATLSFLLTREKTVTSQLKRPQEPQPPYPYREEEVTITADGHTLAGTLTLPQGEGPFPAAVLISGSGPQNRDEELFGHKPFKLIADRLTRAGVAVLRYDDRGTGKSTGNHDTCTSADFADDAEAAVAFLKTRPHIAADRIGLIGHSEGGLIAPMVAARNKDVAYIVLLAGPGVPGDQILQKQLRLMLEAGGMGQHQIDAAVAAQAESLAVVGSDLDPDAAAAALKEIGRRRFEDLPPGQKAAFENAEEFAAGQAEAMNTPWMRFFVRYDPREALSQVKVPVLALNGEKDLQVDAEQNAVVIEQVLREAGNADVTVLRGPGLNHLLQPAETGQLREYGEIETTMDEEALDEIRDWIVKRFVK